MEEDIKDEWERAHSREGGWQTRPIASIAYAHIRKQIAERDTVLELAFGLAENLKELKKRAKGGRVIGIDFSEEAVSKAAEKLKEEPDIEVGLGDVHALPLREKIADKVILTDFFGMYPKEKCIPILREAYRVLKPEGLFMFTAYTREVDGFDGVSSSHPFTESELREFIEKHLGNPAKVEIKTIPETDEEWQAEIYRRTKAKAEKALSRGKRGRISAEDIAGVIAEVEKEFTPVNEKMHLVYLRKPRE